MSKQRQRDRAAREAKAAAARQKAARSTARKERVDRLTPAVPKPSKRQPVYRQRRFPPLPWQLKAALAALWLAALVLTLVLVPTWQGRFGFMVVATMCLPLIVVLVRDPTRRTRR